MADLKLLNNTTLHFAEGAAPSTPDAGEVVLYAKTDGNLYQKDDAGTETSLATAASGLEFTAINRVTVINGATTSATVSRTLTSAIAELPADAVLATGYIDGFTNGAANTSNYMAVFHTSGGTADIAALLRLQMPSGLSSSVPFTAGVVHSSGAKLSYEVGRGANQITYNLYVTGYWAPA